MAIGILLYVVFVFSYPLIVLRPITRVAKLRVADDRRGHFSITDLLSLLFLVQLPVGILNLTDVRLRHLPPIVIGLFIFAAFLAWLAGLRAVNQLGIISQTRRIVLIGLIFPAALLGGFLVIFVWTFASSPVGSAMMIVGFLLGTALIWNSAKWVVNEPR